MVGPGFRLGEATAPERMARDRLTFNAWGTHLSLAQYLDRERTLRQTEHGRLGMRSWVLRLPNGFVAASCETFRLPLAPTGAMEVVASVYVERALRGVKMASRMMEALVNSRREAGLDGLVLFSEVGTGLYAHAGFKLLASPTRRFPAEARTHESTIVYGRSALTELLHRRERLREGRIDLHLTEPIFDWHLARARFYAAALGRPEPTTIGARDEDVLALWVPDFKNDVLRLLDVSGPPGASLEAVAGAARSEAARLGLSAVELWDDAMSALLPGGEPFARDDDLPMGISFTPRGELFLGPLSRACWA